MSEYLAGVDGDTLHQAPRPGLAFAELGCRQRPQDSRVKGIPKDARPERECQTGQEHRALGAEVVLRGDGRTLLVQRTQDSSGDELGLLWVDACRELDEAFELAGTRGVSEASSGNIRWSA